ncbi:MAG: hypothetical protein IJD22_00880 [Clostridia bacterium]|nr:hypothetical protein [Clostridia bacterium]
MINSFSIGKRYEAYFVCPSEHNGYFENVALWLEREAGIRSTVFVHDRDELTPETEKDIAAAENVIFVLTQGATERAAANESDPLRRVYSFVAKSNEDSISLIAANGCSVSYDIVYPEEMISFKWLHRKKYDLRFTSPEKTAKQLCEELRHSYPPAVRRRLDQLAAYGLPVCTEIYETLYKSFLRALILTIVCGLCFLGLYLCSALGSSTEGFTGVMTFVCIAGIPLTALGALGFAAFGVGKAVYYNAQLKDVSQLFISFKQRTNARLAIAAGELTAAALVGMVWLVFAQLEPRAPDLAIIIYAFAVVLLVLGLAMAKALNIGNVLETSLSFTEYRANRRPVDRLFLIIIPSALVAAVIAFLVLRFLV